MAYTDDWESLMNGVFGPGGRFKAAPGTSAPKAGGSAALPDLNAALLEQQKRLDELLKQQNAQLKTQSDATAAALESSRQMLRDMEDEGLLARGTTDVKPEHLGSFEGLAAEVKQTVLGQDAFVDSVVRAMRRPFVLGTEAPAARNVILLTGGAGTGRHFALEETARRMAARGLLQSDRIATLDLALYPNSGAEKLFLQEELLGSGIGVKGQIQRGDPVALQKAPGRHAAGSFFQCKMPACACPACEQDDVAGGGGFGAQHKGAAHGPHHAVHKSILPQHRLLDLGSKAFKAAQVLRLHVGGAPGQQAFVLHVPQHLAAAFQRGGGGIALGFELGVLLLQQLIQPFLLFQKRRVQVRQGGAAACFGCRSAGGGLESAPRAEHAVHQTFPIIGVCHKTSLRAVLFLSV